MSSTPHYYDFVASMVECPNCKWIGPGKRTVSGECFDTGVEKHCPVCDHYFGFVRFPMSHEMKSRTPAP